MHPFLLEVQAHFCNYISCTAFLVKILSLKTLITTTIPSICLLSISGLKIRPASRLSTFGLSVSLTLVFSHGLQGFGINPWDPYKSLTTWSGGVFSKKRMTFRMSSPYLSSSFSSFSVYSNCNMYKLYNYYKDGLVCNV
mgnify:CR=1 FL=1